MPFNSSGAYTPPSGATTAAPGDVIRSATWNSIFTDISSALTLLGQQLYGTTLVTATTYVPASTDTRLLVEVSAPVNINLPTAASRNGYPLIIKDRSGTASTNVITINCNGADVVEGQPNIAITTDWGAWSLYPITGGWIVMP